MRVKTEGSIADFIKSEDSEVLFPFRAVMSFDSGDITVYAAAELTEMAEELRGYCYEELFSCECVNKISDKAGEYLHRLGLEYEAVYCTEFQIDSREKVNKSLVQDSTEVLLPDSGYENLTECTPDPNREGLLCFGTVLDGKIVSCAVENPHHPSDTVIDIAVETAQGYEGKGYGASNVASLAYYLLDSGVLVTYTAEESNIPSVRLAEKVGFTAGQRTFFIAAFKTD